MDEEDSDDEPIQFTQQIKDKKPTEEGKTFDENIDDYNKQKEAVNQKSIIRRKKVEPISGLGDGGTTTGGGVTAKIRMMQGGVTKLIQGASDFKVPNSKWLAKAVS